MVFSSPVFLFIFLTSVYVLYRIIPTTTAKNILLLVFSIAFYTYGEPKAVVLMIISIFMNYFFGLAMKKENKMRKPVLAVSVTANLLMLGIFKYAGFGAQMLNKLPFVSVSIPQIALPIGISFYTFQAILRYRRIQEPEIHSEESLQACALHNILPAAGGWSYRKILRLRRPDRQQKMYS